MKQQKLKIRDIINLLEGYDKNPKKFRLFHGSIDRASTVDPVKTNKDGEFIHYKGGPEISIHLIIEVKEDL